MTGPRALLTAGFLTLILAGCGEQIQEGQQESPEQGTQGEQPVTTERTTQVATGGDRVSVGGFSVEDPGGTETTIPRVSVEREAAREYLSQVQPIVEDTALDVSGLVQPEVRLENGQLVLDVGLDSLREGRENVRGGLERLRQVRPPEGLEPIHERLISAYERVLPAYDNVIEAAESGDPDRLSSAVRESLPRIERFNDEVSAIVQDLQQATETE
jgi:hypothetical protein